MTRPFEFDATAKQRARIRQQGRCALCGEDLADLFEHAHHVVPNQSANPSDPTHSWVRSVENCVILCDLCHDRVHQDGRFRIGAIAAPDYFGHSHGVNKMAHKGWVTRLRASIRRVWS
jgi:hypothetical protein